MFDYRTITFISAMSETSETHVQCSGELYHSIKYTQITAPDSGTTRALISSFESPQPTNISATGTNIE